MYIIYALADPRDGKVHYVGMTDNVYKRFLAHVQCSGRNFGKNVWLLSMREANVMAQMLELERVEDIGRARVREVYWINHYASLDHPITNIQRSAPRLLYKILVRSSGVRSPKAAIAAVENELQSAASIQISEEQVETEVVVVKSSEPENGVNGLIEPTEPVQNAFIPVPGDKLLTDLQKRLVITYYEDCHDVKEALRRIKNEKGEGLGIGTYYHHACFVLDSLGLRKKRA